jgi:hypothetical protein
MPSSEAVTDWSLRGLSVRRTCLPLRAMVWVLAVMESWPV